MSYAEEMMKKFQEEDNQNTSQETQETHQEAPEDSGVPESTPEEKTAPGGPETQPEDKPEETPEEKPEEKPEDKPQETPDEKPQEKPDLSTLTKEQKAEHAFKRQLAKQASKYENIISEMNGKFDKVTAELAEIKKSKAEAEKKPLTRDQFEYDDDFVKALVKQGMDEELAKQKAQQEAEKAEADKKAAEEKELQEAQQRTAEQFNRNCRAAFQDEKEYAEFEKKIQKGVANGLGEFLDQAPAIREFIFEQPEGPVVLNEMLSNKDAFVRVMSQAANPIASYLTMHDMFKEIQARVPQEAQEDAPKPKSTMPPIGKPGAKQSGSAGDMWSSDDQLIDFVRKHK